MSRTRRKTGMARTQVYLTKDIVASVARLARARSQPEAAVIRDLLRAGLEQATDSQPRNPAELIGKYRSGSTRSSSDVDSVLYGKR